MDIDLICVGGLKEAFWKSACAEYGKRLGAWAHVRIMEIREERLAQSAAPREIENALQKEATRIEAKIPPGSFVVALCVEGGRMASAEFSKCLAQQMNSGRSRFAFIIGGSYGLAPQVKREADMRLSMSCMTFPHMLARVMLLEQLYRALSILNGGKYNK